GARDLLSTSPDVILLDLILPDGNGLELLRDATTREGDTQVVVITGHATLESSIEAMRHGATDYLLKPINLSQLRGVLSRVARPPELSAEVKDLRSELRSLGHYGRLVGGSAPMQRLYDQIGRVPATAAPVPRDQLRRDIAADHRKRAVRPREGQLHRRQSPTSRLFRARAWR